MNENAEILAAIRLLQERGIILGGFDPARHVLKIVPSTRSRSGHLHDSISAILEGGPLKTCQLLAKLDAAGVDVGGKRPMNTLSANLSNYPDKYQRNAKDGTWSIAP